MGVGENMRPLLTAEEMREFDRETIEEIGIPGVVLMENAGRHCARIAEEWLPASKGRVAVFCGAGNNGGDGYVIARHLSNRGHLVTVFLLAPEEKIKGDARINLDILTRLGGRVIPVHEKGSLKENHSLLKHAQVVVDALLGTGLNSEVRGPYREAIDLINELEAMVLAVDIPSGIDADLGKVHGAAVKADHTVTFACPKRGHYLFPGADYRGRLSVVDIGIPGILADRREPGCLLSTEEEIGALFGARPLDSHKGTFGHLLVVAGSTGKTGAAILCGNAAMNTGAGLVTITASREAMGVIETMAIEVMCESLMDNEDDLLKERSFERFMRLTEGKTAVALGPGIAHSPGSVSLIRRIARECTLPLVIDADGLNALAGKLTVLEQAAGPRILTPHPGEMARLAGVDTKAVQSDRIGITREMARRTKATVALKGAHTVVSEPNGRTVVNPTGNPGMASGGMGDVLTGIIGSLLCQGFSPWEATSAGVFLHGLAADLASQKKGERGLIARDVIDAVPQLVKNWEQGLLLGSLPL